LIRHWLSVEISSRGRPFQADQLPGFIAWVENDRVGQITIAFDARESEIVTLSTSREDCGVGTLLLAAAENAVRERGCPRMMLTTSNDNLRALAFYQRRGWRLVCVHCGIIDRYREQQKAIPVIGLNGLPLHDEIELSLDIRGSGCVGGEKSSPFL
jgi:hypothetical protein